MKYGKFLSATILFVLQVLLFYYGFRYLFPFKEQMQLFLYTELYACSTLQQAGGVSLYLSAFLSQFYLFPLAGSLITSFLLTCVWTATCSILKKINPHPVSLLLCALPWLSLLIMHFDYDYWEQGTVAYLFFLLSFRIYIQLKPVSRLAYASGCIPALYMLAGPVASLFAGCAVLYEFLMHTKTKYFSLLFLPLAGITAWTGTVLLWSRDLTAALLPEAYYDPMLHSSKIYSSWYVFPAILIISAAIRKSGYLHPKGRTGYVFYGIQGLLALLILYQATVHFGRLDTLGNLKQDYLVRTENWNQLIADFNPTDLTRRKTCILNLALAQTGQLNDRLFEFPQNGIETLLLPWDQSVFTAELHSDIYYCMGLVNASRKFAFEGLVSSRPSGNPRLIKRLVETNVITGAYAVAEKYIALLENTQFYKEWAAEQRRFLYNDTAVENDKILGIKRRCWLAEKDFEGTYVNPVSTLWKLMPACPGNRGGMQYLIAFLLLNKDLKLYAELQQKLYGTAAWPELSVCQQEAVVICAPNNPKYWLEHGVGIPVRNRALAFMNSLPRNINIAGSDARALLAPQYGQTYWYYYMFYTK